MSIEVIESDSETAAALSQAIPEFTNPHPAAEYDRRMAGRKKLILSATLNGKPAGFKAGYDKYGDGSFYSWMGGVRPAYRMKHVAHALADAQEQWARKEGYTSIVFKTRNRHKSMLIFALKNGFYITEVNPHEDTSETRIILRKEL
jgi:GNAT superfamily N-acetyltransferase